MTNTPLFGILALSLVLTSCRDKGPKVQAEDQEETSYFTESPTKVASLTSNGLANEPTDFLVSQAQSDIHWQPWDKDLLEKAELSQKLIFVFIGSTSHMNSSFAADLLAKEFADEINEKYIPVMADLDLDSSLALTCNFLAAERLEPVAFPYLIWLSHEGNPVAWIPLQSNKEERLLTGFKHAQSTVETVLKSSQRYVIENSRYDNKGRRERIAAMLKVPDEAPAPFTTKDYFRAGKELIDLYDDIDETFDRTGGLPPANLITALSRVGEHPAATARFRKEAQSATQGALQHLVTSPIRDPLDGTFFSRRASRSFAIPSPTKHLSTQSEMLSALASVPQTPETAAAEQQLLATLADSPPTASSVVQEDPAQVPYFWSLEAISNALTDDEMKIASLAFELRSLGNIPATDDPRRDYFRRNSLGLKLQGAELADAAHLPQKESDELLASVLTKLATLRAELFTAGESLLTESSLILAHQARLLTAYSRSQAAHPNPITLARAERLADELLTRYRGPDGSLLRCASDADDRLVPAFASDYTQLTTALLELHQLNWNPELLEEARKLTNILLNDFVSEEGYLVEQKPSDSILNFPVYSDRMIFGPSSWAAACATFRRLQATGYQHPKLQNALERMSTLLDRGLSASPIIFTDHLLSGLVTREGYVLVVSPELEAEAAASLRQGLAQPKFDSIFALPEGETTANLGSLQGQIAVLYQNGEPAQKFSSAADLLLKLEAHLAGN